MWKPAILCLTLLVPAFCPDALANYDRNQAQQVEKVTYGNILSVRHISKRELVEDEHQGWRTFGGALLGGVIGRQFGSGSGRDVSTVLGAVVGGMLGNRAGNDQIRDLALVELMIQLEDDSQVMVLQDEDPSMPFQVGDQVRVVYLKGSVRVDKAM